MNVADLGQLKCCEKDDLLAQRGAYESQLRCLPKVSEVMTSTSIWCYEEDVLTDAARMLADHHIRRLLVFNRDKNLVGLLSLDDLAAKMNRDRLLGSVLRQVTAVAA